MSLKVCDDGKLAQIHIYYVLGHYPSSRLGLKCHRVCVSKHNVSETGFYLRLHVKPTQFDPIDRASV
jgi:hypothetical protein